jgi:hypothetical protein
MTMVLKFVTKEGLRFPYTKQEEAEFYSRNANGHPSTAAAVAGKASARPELENSQDLKQKRSVQYCLQLKFIIEPHFASRKSLM